MRMTEEEIRRIARREFKSAISKGGNVYGGSAGYATESWVDTNYLSIEFFNRLFTIHGRDSDDNEITVLPNDMESTIDAIESMFGFWTNFYLAALGTGGDIQLGVTLAALDDVNVSGVSDGDGLVYDAATGKWVPGSTTSGTVTEVGMSVPSGLSVSPSRITSSGTFAITFASGYSLPTTSKQSEWDTGASQAAAAYGWGNHAAQGYLKSTSGTFWGQSWQNGGTVTGDMSSVGNIALGSDKRIYQSSSHLYIGRSDNSGWVRTQDICSQDGTAGDGIWSIRTDGRAVFQALTCASLYSSSYVTALSDIRKKDVKKSFIISLDDLAKMNAIKFVWKDKKKGQELQAGAIAQEWQHILPEVVHEQKNGDLTLDYATAALVSAISLAKEVKELKEKIEILQSHNKVTLGQRIRNFIKKLFS